MSYYATKKLDIPNLIMITGSHNPKEYNGLKIIINNKPFFGDKIKSLNDLDDASLSTALGQLTFKDVITPYTKEINQSLIKFFDKNSYKVNIFI